MHFTVLIKISQCRPLISRIERKKMYFLYTSACLKWRKLKKGKASQLEFRKMCVNVHVIVVGSKLKNMPQEECKGIIDV